METKPIPTSEEFIKNLEIEDSYIWGEEDKRYNLSELLHEYAVLLARHHVKEALRCASNESKVLIVCSHADDESKYEHTFNDELKREMIVIVDPHSILNAYPEDRMK